MVKLTDNHMAFKDFEKQANEFISLTFAYCEGELRQIRLHSRSADQPRRQALPSAALSIQQSIKAFLAISRMKDE